MTKPMKKGNSAMKAREIIRQELATRFDSSTSDKADKICASLSALVEGLTSIHSPTNPNKKFVALSDVQSLFKKEE